MRTLAVVVSVVALFLASSCATAPRATQPQPGMVQGGIDREAAVKVTCKVMAIDQKSRIVTLKGPAGNHCAAPGGWDSTARRSETGCGNGPED